MCKITATQEDIFFWTGFYKDEDCLAWASKKAYLDMNRTMTFKDIPKNDSQKEKKRVTEDREGWQKEGTDVIRNNIITNKKKIFNDWHKDVCNGLICIYKNNLVKRDDNKRTDEIIELTYGQAQKWLNMTLKYLWLLNRLGLIDDIGIRNFINTHEKSFHVPLDSYILKYVAKQDKSKKDKFALSNGLNPSENFDDYWNFFDSAWSRIQNADKYYEYQEKLAKAVVNASPLEWELIHWHKALKYYG